MGKRRRKRYRADKEIVKSEAQPDQDLSRNVPSDKPEVEKAPLSVPTPANGSASESTVQKLIVVHQSDPKSKPSRLDHFQQIAKTLSLVAIPLVVAAMGQVIREAISRRNVQQEYVKLAVSILSKDDVDPSLQQDAIDLLNENSETQLDAPADNQRTRGPILPENPYASDQRRTDSARGARRFARPVPVGCSIGIEDGTAQTLGCLVVTRHGKLCALTSCPTGAKVGDKILQPGPIDGGSSGDEIGVVENLIPVDFNSPNTATGLLVHTSRSLVERNGITFNIAADPVTPAPSLIVEKQGRTTGRTIGVIQSINVNNVLLDYGEGKTATFNGVFSITGLNGSQFSAGGDSGAIVVSGQSKRPIGMIIGTSSAISIAVPLKTIMEALKIRSIVAE